MLGEAKMLKKMNDKFQVGDLIYFSYSEWREIYREIGIIEKIHNNPFNDIQIYFFKFKQSRCYPEHFLKKIS